MHLRLLSSPSPPSGAFDPEPLDLTQRPTRPGLAHSELLVDLGPELGSRAGAAAAADGQPLALWAAWVIESERVLGEIAGSGAALAAELDRLAERPGTPTPGGATRLAEYATQLRRTLLVASSPARPSGDPPGSLRVLLPDASLTSWRRAAIAAAQALDEWAAGRLGTLPRRRALWEAAAAERGETLAEWILAQAARRRAA